MKIVIFLQIKVVKTLEVINFFAYSLEKQFKKTLEESLAELGQAILHLLQLNYVISLLWSLAGAGRPVFS